MTAMDVAVLERDCTELAKMLRNGLYMLPDNSYKLTISKAQAAQLLSVIERTGSYFSWKLETTEVVNKNGRNKKRSTGKRK